MDNMKTGALIKALRKERDMTQKELADQLNITDRAVSKWERGVCAPDISTLEPLADILHVTVAELLSGARLGTDEPIGLIEQNVQNVISYSEREIVQKTSAFRRRYLAAAGACAVVVLLFLAVLWWKGYFNVVYRAGAPDGSILLTVYDRDIARTGSPRPTVTVRSSGGETATVVYGGSEFEGVWWSPDSMKYVLALKTPQGTRLSLDRIEGHSSSDLNAYLSFGVEMNELARYGLRYGPDSPLPEIQYRFLQWGLDSRSMLIYYTFIDADQEDREGYFWYDCEAGTMDATLELPSPGV